MITTQDIWFKQSRLVQIQHIRCQRREKRLFFRIGLFGALYVCLCRGVVIGKVQTSAL